MSIPPKQKPILLGKVSAVAQKFFKDANNGNPLELDDPIPKVFSDPGHFVILLQNIAKDIQQGGWPNVTVQASKLTGPELSHKALPPGTAGKPAARPSFKSMIQYISDRLDGTIPAGKQPAAKQPAAGQLAAKQLSGKPAVPGQIGVKQVAAKRAGPKQAAAKQASKKRPGKRPTA